MTTVKMWLSERLGFTPFYEPHEENPYLADFYEDMESWSYQSQVYFLTRRLKIHNELLFFDFIYWFWNNDTVDIFLNMSSTI